VNTFNTLFGDANGVLFFVYIYPQAVKYIVYCWGGFLRIQGNNGPSGNLFVCGMSDYTCNYNLVPGYDAYCMSSFILYEGHTDNLQQLLKSNHMLD